MERHCIVWEGFGKGYIFTQKELCGDVDPTLSWGPLETTLGQMFQKGFMLWAESSIVPVSSPRRIRIYLRDNSVSKKHKMYRIGSAQFTDLMVRPLQDFIKKEPVMTGSEMNFPWWYDDPIAAIKAAFPVKTKKKKILMGNQTLSEWVASQP